MISRLWRRLSGQAEQRRLQEALKTLQQREQCNAAALSAFGASTLTVEFSGETAVVVDLCDPLNLFEGRLIPPISLTDVARFMGETRDISDALNLVVERCKAPLLNESTNTEPPVFAIPPREGARSGSISWISIYGSAITPLAGEGDAQPHRILLVLSDVTRTRHRMDDMERKLALLNRALDRSPFGMAVVDADGLMGDANSAFRRLIGRRPVQGRLFQDLFHKDDLGRLANLFNVVLEGAAGERPVPEPLDMRLALTEERIVTLYANRTVIPDKDRPGILFHVLDSTERKRLESQFAQSQKMEAVGQLAGGIAHDFNNVLTAIIGFCDLLLHRHQPGDPSFGDVMQIQQNANRAAGLTRQLLAFSRQQAIRTRVVDVTDMLAELSNLLQRLLGETVELQMIHGRDLWPVKGDRGQLEQGIINLAVNARDAMERGGRLILQTDNFSADRPYQMRDQIMPPADYVMITVTDTGMGMTPVVLGRIFEPFFTTKEVGQGTGLGLAMVYGSVTQMGGYIVAHSDGPGKGTSFSLYLPRATEQERDAAEREGGGENAELPSLDDTGGERIMLVEDEDAVRLFSARALRSKGYDVTEARTGEVALEILKEQTFDL
ncbi:MAG: ATP-binding protein, partial [Alphaproteobacteria bacterium]|nr:ATP-binding protein [Alphaproteobacteria bacterium]